MAFTIRGLFLNSSNEAVTTPTPDEDNPDAKDLHKIYPTKIKKTIANCRYAFDNDPTLQGIILNNAFTASNKFRITSDNKKAEEYIQKKADEWNLGSIMANTLIKVSRDGCCFIEKAKVKVQGSDTLLTIDPRFLSFDDDKYKFEIIRDPKSDKIIGFKQTFQKAKKIENWESAKPGELKNEMVEDWANYTPDKLIYPVLIEGEGGKARSLVMTLLGTINRKWMHEGFMDNAAHKAGTLIGLTVGNERVKNADVPKSFVNKLIRTFRSPVEKDVAIIPDGVSADVIGNSTLPEIPLYLKYIRNEMFILLQTPEALFSTESSNRATAEIQADDKTGYGVFIAFLRFFLKKYFEKELIDAELALQPSLRQYVGTVKIVFDEEETPTALADEEEAKNVSEESDFEEDEGTTPTEE